MLDAARLARFVELRDAIIDDKAPLVQSVTRLVEFYRTSVTPTWTCLRGINCYRFVTRTGNTLPVAAFVCIAPPPGRADYYAAVLRIVLRRHQLDEARFVNDRLDALTEASLLGEVLTAFIAYCAYARSGASNRCASGAFAKFAFVAGG